VESPKCRNCGLVLKGKPYHLGSLAYHPVTGERCKSNYYGGWVCSKDCDYRASVELEKSMPGGMPFIRLSSSAEQHHRGNWDAKA